jgi:SNF2 family DNA or RNA helicase
MIAIIDHYLTKTAIGHTVLTGSSKNRDEIVKQFAEDTDCKVFVGSLKAGGVGIDLVAASVVIHYDRWWNAAKEDQATDRVHRIGQKQGVQVVKIVTEGTIEEKIDKIITMKKDLANELLTEDSVDTVKVFSREELIDLLSITK